MKNFIMSQKDNFYLYYSWLFIDLTITIYLFYLGYIFLVLGVIYFIVVLFGDSLILYLLKKSNTFSFNYEKAKLNKEYKEEIAKLDLERIKKENLTFLKEYSDLLEKYK